MRLTTAVISLLFTILTVPAFAQAAECEQLAKAVVAVVTNGKADAKVIGSTLINIENVASGSLERVERIVLSTGASEIVVDTLPSYYVPGVCEIKSVQVVRE